MVRSTGAIVTQAVEALEALSVEPPRSDTHRNLRWLKSDRDAFTETAYFERYVADGLPREIPVTMREHLGYFLSDWRAALPYSEAERDLVFNIDCFAADPALIRGIGRAVILDSGLEYKVSGRELMQRWFKWRRRTDQCDGVNRVHIARTALFEFVTALGPLDHLPPLSS